MSGCVQSRNNRLAALIAERGLKTKGFRRSLRELVKECGDPSECEDSTIEERVAFQFDELFGDCSVVPAAYRIIKGDGPLREAKVEVYEVENSIELADHKWGIYGTMADCDEAEIELHILDKYDNEIVVPHDNLMSFMMFNFYSERDPKYAKAMMKDVRARAVAQHHAPVIVDDKSLVEAKREINSLEKRIESEDRERLVRMIHGIIYGLGRKQSHEYIAQRVGCPRDMIKDTVRFLSVERVDPVGIVKDTHAKWKVAYDAVREMGIAL